VLACLLHDVGHMIHQLGDNPAARGVDDGHEQLGADWLAERFGAEVSEPVRLHVAAKRYLCTVEPDYLGKLAPDSVRSLELQGGLMCADESRPSAPMPCTARRFACAASTRRPRIRAPRRRTSTTTSGTSRPAASHDRPA
jgi:predicted HD phosphohydrolase